MTGLPAGVAYDLFADPTNANVLYTASVFSNSFWWRAGWRLQISRPGCVVGQGQRCVDGCVDRRWDGAPTRRGTSNIEITVGNADNVYVAILNGGNLAGLFRSGDGGTNWTAMDNSINQRERNRRGAESQGWARGRSPDQRPRNSRAAKVSIHFSMVADPGNPFVIYAGGDRQPGLTEFGVTRILFPELDRCQRFLRTFVSGGCVSTSGKSMGSPNT